MNETEKKIIKKTFLFTIGLLFFENVSFADETFEEVQHWDCGTNCQATLFDNGLLRVTPTAQTGTMGDYLAPEIGVGMGRLTTAPWAEYKENIERIEIADGITGIGNSCFTGLYNVTDVKIADSVTSIGFNAFGDERQLTTVRLSNNLTNLEAYAFGLAHIEHIDLPYTLQTIGRYALWGTKLQDLSVPDSVTSIGYGAFASVPANKIYCNNTNDRCNKMIADDYSTVVSKFVNYTKEGGRYVLNGKRYRSFEDMKQDVNALKRIYTIEEAEAAVKEIGKDHVSFKIRYK